MPKAVLVLDEMPETTAETAKTVFCRKRFSVRKKAGRG